MIGHTSAKINISYSILFNLTTSYSSYFGGKKGISRNKTSFFLLMQALVEQASILTRDHLILPPSSHSWMFHEWNADYSQKPHNPRYKPLFKESSTSLHPFTLGCLDDGSRWLQSTTFQTITSHSFHADYSDRFCLMAGDTTLCPSRSCHWQHKHFTISHALTSCPALSHARSQVFCCYLSCP